MIISDVFDFAPSSRTYTDNGFLRVTGKAARTGVYKYLASELALTDRAPNEIVNVLRSPDEVFNDNSLATYTNADVTNDHPKMLVDAVTYKGISVGHVIGAKQSGDFVDVDLIIKDAQAITDIESGKSQLSPGYKATYVQEKGVFDATGETYEFKQTGIDVNHVAIVKRGRGGAQVRIDDNHQEVTPMSIKIMFDGQSLEVADEASAKLVTDAFEKLTKQVSDAESKVDKADAEKEAMEEKLKAEKLKSSDAAIVERVKAIAEVNTQAAKMVGDTFTCDSVDVMAIQRAALLVKRPTVDWVDKSDVYVQAAFDMAINDADVEPVKVNVNDQLAQFAKDASGDVAKEVKLTAYDTFKSGLSDAWKGE